MHSTNSGLMPRTPYGHPRMPGMILECRTRSITENKPKPEEKVTFLCIFCIYLFSFILFYFKSQGLNLITQRACQVPLRHITAKNIFTSKNIEKDTNEAFNLMLNKEIVSYLLRKLVQLLKFSTFSMTQQSYIYTHTCIHTYNRHIYI